MEDELGKSKLRRLVRSFWDLAKIVAVSVAIIIPVRAYVAQPFFVRGASMSPNFHGGEYLIVDELSYNLGLREPRRGDVVVFRYPLDPTQYYIKRIIALPNERVVVRDGKITIINESFPKGIELGEKQYLNLQEKTEGNIDVSLNSNEYYVLGDNRDHSSDSRSWGAVPRELIVGKAWVRLFPVAKAGPIENTQYGGLTPALSTQVGNDNI